MGKIDTGISLSASPHAQGSATPVESAVTPSWPSGGNPHPGPGEDGVEAMNFDSCGCTDNILDAPSSPTDGYALGRNRPD